MKTRFRLRFLISFPVILMLLLGGTTPLPAGVQYWCTHSLDNVFRDTIKPTASKGIVVVSGARNQTVGAQVVLRSAGAPDKVTSVTCTSLVGAKGTKPVNSSAFSYAFIEYHHIAKNSSQTPPEELARKAPADFPDAFLEGGALMLPADTNQPVWVEFNVPRDAAPGLYTGKIIIKLQQSTLTVPVQLHVYDFMFPSDTRLMVTLWTDHEALPARFNLPFGSEGHWKLLANTAKIMRRHHQNVIFTPWRLIKAVRTSGGLQFDYAQFDRWVETFLKEGFKRIELYHLGGRENGQWDDKNFTAYRLECKDAITGQVSGLQLEDWLPALQRHLELKGWLSRTLAHIADEPISVNFESWKLLSERVHKCAPRLKRIDAIHVPELKGYLEVMVPQLNYLEQWRDRYEDAHKSGAEIWYYTAWVPQGHFPNRLLDYPLIKTRILFWMNYFGDTTGFLHWGFNFWSQPIDQQLAPGDNWVVWIGDKSVRSGLRYEAMREGIEDYEYLKTLENRADRIARKLRKKNFDARKWTMSYCRLMVQGFQTYNHNPKELFSTRDKLARVIEALDTSKTPLLAWARGVEGGKVEVSGVALPGSKIVCGEARTRADVRGEFTLRTNLSTQEAKATVVVEVINANKRNRLETPVSYKEPAK